MIPRRLKYTLVCMLALVPAGLYAQLDLSTVAVRGGAIPSQTPNYFEPGNVWSFYPEIEIGGHLFAPYLTWGVTWGYWSDGIDQPKPWADFVTYSRSGHILSTRMRFSPRQLAVQFPLPLTLSIGIAEHFVKTTYIGGTDLVGKSGVNATDQAVSGLVGAGLSVPIWTHFTIEGQVVQYIPLGNDDISSDQSGRRSFTVGLGYSF